MSYKMPPYVYYIKQLENNSFILQPEIEKFTVENKMYGNKKNLAIRIWNTFATAKKSVGALFTGGAGTGKTETAKLIGNIALSNGLPVIMVTDINTSIELVNFLNGLRDCVIVFDEFAKNFNYQLQEKMLTMFSSVNGYKKLFILTENTKTGISDFIKNRPGRILYSIDFSRVDKLTIDEFCRDHNVSNDFYNALLTKYESSIVFSIDMLRGLVEEHLKYPNDTIDELIEVLNVDILSAEIKYGVESVTDKATGEEVKTKHITIPVESFTNGSNYWIGLAEGYSDFNINNKMITNITKIDNVTVLTLDTGKYIIKLKEFKTGS